jgi:hypothetical protein
MFGAFGSSVDLNIFTSIKFKSLKWTLNPFLVDEFPFFKQLLAGAL